MHAVGQTHIRGFFMSKQQSGETAVQSSPTDRRRFLNRVLDTGAASLMAMALPAIAADGDAATQRSPRFDAAPANNESFDYVIVGAGSAGSVLARRLVDAGMRVLVLEAGPPDTLAAIHDPTKAAFLWHTPVDWSFTTRAQSHSLDTTVYWPRGKTLGGSSSINGMMYVRGLPVDYDNWVAAGATGWGWKDVQPYFRKSERCHATGLSAAHGTDGLLDVTQPEPTPLARAFVDASVQAGLRHVIDYNDGEDSSGVSFPQFTITPAGERASAWECYVRPIAASDRLTVLTGAQVLNVVIEKGVATGVRYLHDGKPLHVRAVREVLLSAGSIMSPAILMHSGIGPASQLRKLGIKVVADVPGVGANLHDHLVCPLLWSSRRPVAMGGTSGMNAHLFHKSHPSLAAPDTQSLLFTMPVPVPDYPKVEQGFTLYAGLDRPYSRGRLWLRSANPLDKPALDPNIYADRRDLDAMLAKIAVLRDVMAQPALKDWRGEEVAPGRHVAGGDALRRYVEKNTGSYHHQVGTARMGRADDPAAVLDASLQVRGVERLRVVDASAMPIVPTGNTNAPTIMLAERASDMILARRS